MNLKMLEQIKRILNNISADETRNDNLLHITANEARMSKTAKAFLSSNLAERYYMGGGEDEIVDFGAFTARGMKPESELIELAIESTKKMLNAQSVNLSVLSGVHAMMSSILSVTEPGDTVMTVKKADGGHFATQGILERVGRKQVFAEYDTKGLRFLPEETAKVYKESGATAFYMDVSYYLNPHNLQELRDALGKDAVIIYDASHTMGLILGHQFQDPFAEGADVISANTHKTLPGPHKGMIVFKDSNLADRANKIIDGCLYSTPMLTHLLALSTTLLEMAEYGEEYAKNVIENSNSVGRYFSELGYEVRKSNTGRFSENHQTHIFLEGRGDRIELYKRLLTNGISTNFDTVLGGKLFIRFGTQEITRRGFKDSDINTLAQLIDQALKGDDVKSKVYEFNNSFNSIQYSFDKDLGL